METTRRQEEEEEEQQEATTPSEIERLIGPFFGFDANQDGFVSKKEYRTQNVNGNVDMVFEKYDADKDRRISKTEFLHYHNVVAVKVPCDTFGIDQCAKMFKAHLQTQEERLEVAGSTVSSNGLFCTALQIYIKCIAEYRRGCPELDTYAQRIKRTSIAYRNAGVCPELNTTVFNAPNANTNRRHRTDTGDVVGETRRRSHGSRQIRAAKRTSLNNEDCVRNAFASCHNDLYASVASEGRSGAGRSRERGSSGCTITKNYRTCIKRSTKRCRNKSYVNKIMSGLKYIRKVHREARMCGLQT